MNKSEKAVNHISSDSAPYDQLVNSSYQQSDALNKMITFSQKQINGNISLQLKADEPIGF